MEFGFTAHIRARGEEAQAIKREAGYKARPGNGYASYKPPQERRREERGTGRTYEEAVGENGEDAS